MNKRVVIINGWSDLNAGDSGIIMSLIDIIRKKYKKCDITILSELSKNNEYYKTSIDMIRMYYNNISLISAPFFKKYQKGFFYKIREMLSFIKCIIISQLPKTLITILLRNNSYYESIINADIIISKGGHFFHTDSSLHGFVHIFKCAYPMIISRKLQKKYYMIAQSFGPLFKKGLLSNITFNISKKVIENATYVSVREEASFNYLKDSGFKMSNIHLTSDYAFMLNSDKYLEENELKEVVKRGGFVVITLRQHQFKTENGENEYLHTINNIASNIVKKYNYNIVFVPHVQGPNQFENDKYIIEKFKSKYSNHNYIYTTGYYSAKTLKKLYSYAIILIGTRFHSVIFALGETIPCFAISYSGYKATIINQFEMGQFMVDINKVNNKNASSILELIFELIEKNDEYKALISKKMVNIKQLINNDSKNFLSLIDK